LLSCWWRRTPRLDIIDLKGSRYLTLHFSWSLDATDAILSLQGSSDLATWETIPIDDPALHLFILDEPAVNPQRRTLTIRDVAPLENLRLLRLIAD
jgi:hypothetical protein